MTIWLTLTISLISLIISITTAWLTFFRKGKLLMTQPTMIFFGPDGKSGNSSNKIYLRTLLYSTAKKGQVIENMYVQLERGETKQNFSFWVYGDTDLNRGSGLFVSESGIACNHHFLLPSDGSDFKFLDGLYTLSVYAKLVNNKSSKKLYSINLSISKEQAESLKNNNSGLFFDWGPDRQRYYSHIDTRPLSEKDFSELFFNEISKGKASKHSKK